MIPDCGENTQGSILTGPLSDGDRPTDRGPDIHRQSPLGDILRPEEIVPRMSKNKTEGSLTLQESRPDSVVGPLGVERTPET